MLGAALVAALVVWFPAFIEPMGTGFGDWQMIWHNWEVGRVAIARFGEWPLWDPFHCGGIPVFGNPESQHFSPFFPLAVVLGTTWAIKIFLVLHAAIGFFGMYVLARREYALTHAAAAMASVTWAASGFFAWHGSGGHGTFLPFYFAPWVVLALRASVRDLRWSAALAAIMALVVLEGGTYPFPYLVLLVAFDAIGIVATRPRGSLRVVIALGIGAALAALLGAVRFLPIMELLRNFPRTIESTDSVTVGELLDMLVARTHEYRFGHEFVWAEYGAYVGWISVTFAGIGAVAVAVVKPRRLHLLLGLVFFGALTMGSASVLHPWTWLHQVPVFDSLRVPSRFAVLLTFYLALLAAHGLSASAKLAARLRRGTRAWQVLGWLAVLAAFVDIRVSTATTIDRFDWSPLVTIDPVPSFFLVRPHDYIREYASYPQRGLGTAACYVGGIDWPRASGLRTGPRPQAWVDGRAGRVLREEILSHSIAIDVDLNEEALVIINQNYFADWTTNIGEVIDQRGQLAVRLPAGHHHVLLDYQPRSLVPSLLLSLVGLFAALGVARWGQRICRR